MKSFLALLDGLNAAHPDRRPEIERLILDTFQVRKAVLALDMSGFTLSVRRDGILSYLCQIRLMQQLTLPMVRSYDGDLVKCEADNLLAVFDDASKAVQAAVAMNRAVAAMNAVPGNQPDLAFSIGIDYGEFLLIDGSDCFGDAVNLAYKLGEDIARPGEVLITEEVQAQLGSDSIFRLQQLSLSVTGIEVKAYCVLY